MVQIVKFALLSIGKFPTEEILVPQKWLKLSYVGSNVLAGGGREKKFADLQSQICSDLTQKTAVGQASRVYHFSDQQHK